MSTRTARWIYLLADARWKAKGLTHSRADVRKAFLATLLIVVLTPNARAQEWHQLFGDQYNSNYTPCQVTPPLVVVWEVSYPKQHPFQTLAAEGIIATSYSRNIYPLLAGLSAATGDILWKWEFGSDKAKRKQIIPWLYWRGWLYGHDEWFRDVTFRSVRMATGEVGGRDITFGDVRRGRVSYLGGPNLEAGPGVLVNDVFVFYGGLPVSIGFMGAVSLTTGTMLWWRERAWPIWGGGAVCPRGIGQWGRRPSPFPVWHHKPVTDGHIFVHPCDMGWIAANTTRDGAVIWRDRPGTICPYLSRWIIYPPQGKHDEPNGYACSGSPVLYGKLAIVPFGDGGLVAYEAASGRKRWLFKDGICRHPGTSIVRSKHCGYWIKGFERGEWIYPYGDADYPPVNDEPASTPAIAPGNKAIIYPSQDGFVYCLDPLTGKVRWKQTWAPPVFPDPHGFRGQFAPVVSPYPGGEIAYVHAQEHLYAFDVATGRIVWADNIPAGTFPPIVAYGSLFVKTNAPRIPPGEREQDYWFPTAAWGGSLMSWAPAIRLHRMGVRVEVSGKREDECTERFRGIPEAVGVEVNFDEAEHVAEIANRIKACVQRGAKDALLVVALRWLDEEKKRLALPVSISGKDFGDKEVKSYFLDTCSNLASALKPDYFDLGPECNYYLHHHPEDFRNFISVCAAARDKVKQASRNTKVMVSFQYELWQGWKTRLDDLGSIPRCERLEPQLGLANAFAKFVDCFGVATDPAIYFEKAYKIPLDYYYRLVNVIEKPILFTHIGWPERPGVDKSLGSRIFIAPGPRDKEYLPPFDRTSADATRSAVTDRAALPRANAAETGIADRQSKQSAAGLTQTSQSAMKIRDEQDEFIHIFFRRIYWLDPQVVLWSLQEEDATPPAAWGDILAWRRVPQRPQPGPPIHLQKAVEGF